MKAMKSKFSYILIFSALMGAAIVGCDQNEDILKTSLQAPNTSLDSKSYNKLTFSWEKVANAIQYGYVLTNPSGKVIGEGTTVQTSASFSGLLPNTEYTLKVWAFPSLQSDYSSSPSFTLSGTTDPLKKVSAPQPEACQNGPKVVVSWEAVTEASSYIYSLSGPGINEEDPIETTETELSFSNLEEGVYTFTIYACCTTGGYETKSATSTISFEYIPQKNWRAMGTITYQYYNDGTQIPGVLAYDDDTKTYTLEGWCGVEGYDFSFKVNSDGMSVVGVDMNSNYCYPVPTGLEDPSEFYVYTYYNYSSFEGDKNAGEIWICIYDADWNGDYIAFIWDEETSHPTIDDICGSYLYWNWGYEVYTDWNTWNTFYYETECTISKVDEKTVWMSTLLSYPGFEDCGFSATYDQETLTLNVPIQDFATYYTIGLENDDYANGTAPEEGLVVKIAGDGSFSMDDWVIYYNWSGWWYKYFAYTGSYWYPASDEYAAAKAAAKRALSR